MSTWPSTPRPAAIKVVNEQQPFISDAHNGRRQVVDGLGQRWALDMVWPPLTRVQWSECEGFAFDQGATGIFQLVPHTHATPLGAGLAAAVAATENRLRWSERMDLSPWAYTDAPNTTLGTAIAAPDGKVTGQLWTIAAANAEVFPSLNQAIYVTLGASAIIACYMKAGTALRSAIKLNNATKALDHELVVSWSGGVPAFLSSSGISAYGIVAAGDGWYRIWASLDLATTGESGDAFVAHFGPRYNQASVAAGTYIWGAQVIISSATLKDYLKTWGSSRTRNAGPRVSTIRNLIPYSDTFDDGWWVLSNAYNFGQVTAPDGTLAQTWGSAYGLDGSVNPYIRGASFTASATQYVVSCYVKRGTAAMFLLSIYDVGTTVSYSSRINIAADGTMTMAGTGDVDDRWLEPVAGADGWYRTGLLLDVESRGLAGHTLRVQIYPHYGTESTPRPQYYSAIWRACLETGRVVPGHPLPRAGESDPETETESGKIVRCDGWVGDTAAVLKAGDFLRFAGHTKVYKVAAVADADAWGNASLRIHPALIATPSATQTITIQDVPFTVSLDGAPSEQDWDENIWIRPRLRFVERV